MDRPPGSLSGYPQVQSAVPAVGVWAPAHISTLWLALLSLLFSLGAWGPLALRITWGRFRSRVSGGGSVD